MATTTTVLFVHGTGTREASYQRSFELVSRGLANLDRGLVAAPCYWGHLGARLLGGGKSVPGFLDSGGPATPSNAQLQNTLWSQLYNDPLYELRVLALRGAAKTSFGELSAGDALRDRLAQLVVSIERPRSATEVDPLVSRLRSLLATAQVDDLFARTATTLTQDVVFLGAMQSAADAPDEYRGAVARALVARLADEATSRGGEPRLDFDLALRDDLVRAIQDGLGGEERGLLGLTLKTVMGLGGQSAIRKRRGRFSDLMHPFLGDIILYQSRGEEIRSFLKNRIEEAGDKVVIIAHSLGGIMCADLLITRQIPNVDCLITVGSQAALLYELNSLHSLGFAEPLPERLSASWLNIYDENDFLSYVGGALFGSLVRDVRVDNGSTFPDSHSMYWSNPEVWAAVAKHLPQ